MLPRLACLASEVLDAFSPFLFLQLPFWIIENVRLLTPLQKVYLSRLAEQLSNRFPRTQTTRSIIPILVVQLQTEDRSGVETFR